MPRGGALLAAMNQMTFLRASLFFAVSSLVACGSNPPSPATTEPPAPPATATATAPVTTASPTTEAPTTTPDASAPASAKTCNKSSDCASGEDCVGEEGCDKTWTCQPSRPCTKDLRPYCGCDGKTFQNSGTCPGQKYKKKGAC